MKNKKFMLLILLLLGVGFAAVSTTLYLNGNVNIATNNDDFDVIFTKAVLDETDISSAAIKEGGKKITFETNDLSKVGDISKLDFEVTNNSTMYDAEVSIECTANGAKKSYYEVTKEVASPILGKTTEPGYVQVKLLKASVDDFSETFTCTLSTTAKERTSKAEPAPAPATTFADDSWTTIRQAVKSGTYPYQVGDTKTVDMGSLGTHTLRVANTSPCTNGETSQTACGFVVEFADIITTYQMNSVGIGNVGGWPASEARTYLNNDVLNALPSDLKGVIADTTAVSGMAQQPMRQILHQQINYIYYQQKKYMELHMIMTQLRMKQGNLIIIRI